MKRRKRPDAGSSDALGERAGSPLEEERCSTVQSGYTLGSVRIETLQSAQHL